MNKKMHRMWKEKVCRCGSTHPCIRAGASSIPQVESDAPNGVWALDFRFDSTVDGKAVKIASMTDEHTRLSVLNLVERSITAQRLTEECEKAFTLWGGSTRGVADGERSGIHLTCAATVLPRSGGNLLHPARRTVKQRAHRILQQLATEGVPDRQHWTKREW